MNLTAGVIAVQGDVRAHVDAVERAAELSDVSITVRPVRHTGIVPDCDALVLPGGESTTISKAIRRLGIDDEIKAHVEDDKPMLATCAGLIVAASDPLDARVDSLDILDISVKRNAFGRQRDSFEVDLECRGVDTPVHAVFIRAPVIDSHGRDVEPIATWNGRIVAVRQGSVMGTSFHPELTTDPTIHALALIEPFSKL